VVIIFINAVASEKGRWIVSTCPNCQDQYAPEIAECPVCGASLTETSPPPDASNQENQEDTELQELSKFRTMAEADLMKELLESNGVPTVVRGDADPIGGIELPTILVEQGHFEKARELYNMYFAGESVEDENAESDQS
jgi:hypothetical protein